VGSGAPAAAAAAAAAIVDELSASAIPAAGRPLPPSLLAQRLGALRAQADDASRASAALDAAQARLADLAAGLATRDRAAGEALSRLAACEEALAAAVAQAAEADRRAVAAQADAHRLSRRLGEVASAATPTKAPAAPLQQPPHGDGPAASHPATPGTTVLSSPAGSSPPTGARAAASLALLPPAALADALVASRATVSALRCRLLHAAVAADGEAVSAGPAPLAARGLSLGDLAARGGSVRALHASARLALARRRVPAVTAAADQPGCAAALINQAFSAAPLLISLQSEVGM
jgi:hypothetical protein